MDFQILQTRSYYINIGLGVDVCPLFISIINININKYFFRTYYYLNVYYVKVCKWRGRRRNSVYPVKDGYFRFISVVWLIEFLRFPLNALSSWFRAKMEFHLMLLRYKTGFWKMQRDIGIWLVGKESGGEGEGEGARGCFHINQRWYFLEFWISCSSNEFRNPHPLPGISRSFSFADFEHIYSAETLSSFAHNILIVRAGAVMQMFSFNKIMAKEFVCSTPPTSRLLLSKPNTCGSLYCPTELRLDSL